MIPPPTWEQITGPVGAVVVAVFFAAAGLFATYKGWIVPGTILKQMRQDWKDALKSQTVASEKSGAALGKEVAKEMEKAVTKGVAAGIAKGYLKINGQSKSKAQRRQS